ncbi:putative G-protein coupled receptor CG31760 [Vespula maculifrons]|uniref:G-protein coupled receptor CG31760 n=1 Tax=Vespula maculifrons TaxID=7453 RepID=A0ABD2CE86_VESMC
MQYPFKGNLLSGGKPPIVRRIIKLQMLMIENDEKDEVGNLKASHEYSDFLLGTSGIDIDLRRVDIDQCPLPPGSNQLNIFAASDKCKKRTTKCVAIPGLGFRRGSYRCVCKRGFYYPDTKSTKRYYNGTVIEEEYEKLMMKISNVFASNRLPHLATRHGEESQYAVEDSFECLPCAEGCESCVDGSPCVVSLNWLMRTAILILECCVIACLPAVALFTWKYGNVKIEIRELSVATLVLIRRNFAKFSGDLKTLCE